MRELKDMSVGELECRIIAWFDISPDEEGSNGVTALNELVRRLTEAEEKITALNGTVKDLEDRIEELRWNAMGEDL